MYLLERTTQESDKENETRHKYRKEEEHKTDISYKSLWGIQSYYSAPLGRQDNHYS
jgi:hypothetical protein